MKKVFISYFLFRLKINIIRLNSTLIKQSKSSKNDATNNADQNATKFETYYDFHRAIDTIKPHQTLAINRGESQKVRSEASMLACNILMDMLFLRLIRSLPHGLFQFNNFTKIHKESFPFRF